MRCTFVVRRPSSLTFHIFDLSSETLNRIPKLYRKQDLNLLTKFFSRSEKQDGRPGLWLAMRHFTSPLKPGVNSMKLDSEQDLNVLYQVCVFIGHNGVSRLAHFRLLLWNRWKIQRNFIQKARSYVLVPSHVLSGRSENRNGRPCLMAEFTTSPLKPLIGIQRNLTRRKISTSALAVCVFRAIGKQNGRPCLWLVRHFISSETAEWNSTKLVPEGRSQHPLPSLCFSNWSEKQDGRPGLCWLTILWLLTTETAEQNSTKLDSEANLNVLYQVCVGPIGKTRWPPWHSNWLRHFRLLLWKSLNGIRTKLHRVKISTFYQVCVFRANRKNKMGALASDWLRHFRLLLWNRFERNLRKPVIGSKISTSSSQVCVFRGDR